MRENILKEIEGIIKERVVSVVREIEQLNDAKARETKSSAGDKFETSREMIQLELNKYNNNLNKWKVFYRQYEHIVSSKIDNSSVGVGNGVMTNKGLFFLGIAIGFIDVEGKKCCALSQVSPIGKLLIGKKVGEEFTWKNIVYKVKEVF